MARLIEKPKIVLDEVVKPDPTNGSGGWPLALDHVENWAWKTGVFSDAELDTIIEIGTQAEMKKACTFGPVQNDKNRNSHVQFLFPNEVTNWVFARLAKAIVEINQQFFQFDLHGMDQGLQFTRYIAPGQHYDWHMDRGFLSPTRKLSLSVQLSDPKTYKGGDLQFKFGRKDETVKRERGIVTFFPSYTLHRVRPVTEGTRYSLVAWISGPPFK
jgi:PKHD-type hydroxylase